MGKKEKSRWGDGVDDGAEASHESLWALLLYIQPGADLLSSAVNKSSLVEATTAEVLVRRTALES